MHTKMSQGHTKRFKTTKKETENRVICCRGCRSVVLLFLFSFCLCPSLASPTSCHLVTFKPSPSGYSFHSNVTALAMAPARSCSIANTTDLQSSAEWALLSLGTGSRWRGLWVGFWEDGAPRLLFSIGFRLVGEVLYINSERRPPLQEKQWTTILSASSALFMFSMLLGRKHESKTQFSTADKKSICRSKGVCGLGGWEKSWPQGQGQRDFSGATCCRSCQRANRIIM